LKDKPKILIFIDWYLPAIKAGGPVRSITNLVEALYESYEFYIVCSDRDLLDINAFIGVILNTWQTMKDAKVLYLTEENRSINQYKKIIKDIAPNVIYINGIFSLQFSIRPLIASKSFRSVKTIIAPRGMLGKGALELKSKKKNIFITIFNFIKLYRNTTWHATSVEEASEIQQNIKKVKAVSVVSNITLNGSKKISCIKNKAQLKLVFFSRISQKKNLNFAVDIALELLKLGLANLSLDIFGPIEDEAYWLNIKNKIILHQQITYKGVLAPEDLEKTLKQYHAFILPTLHENYGHVIAEALGNGLPVIISDQTPWRDLKNKKAGFDLSLNDKTKFIESIQYFYNLDETDFEIWRAGSQTLFAEKINIEKIKNEYKQLFS
jgi:glycosyltransferase involved in cell wall biosynthesis